MISSLPLGLHESRASNKSSDWHLAVEEEHSWAGRKALEPTAQQPALLDQVHEKFLAPRKFPPWKFPKENVCSLPTSQWLLSIFSLTS